MREPDGFREFVAARQNALLRTGWLLTGDWQKSEDLVQTALVRVWPHWDRGRAAGDPEAYVRRTLVTTFLTWQRRRWTGEQPHAEMPDVAPDPAAGAAIEAAAQPRRLAASVRDLPLAHPVADPVLRCGVVKTALVLVAFGYPDRPDVPLAIAQPCLGATSNGAVVAHQGPDLPWVRS